MDILDLENTYGPLLGDGVRTLQHPFAHRVAHASALTTIMFVSQNLCRMTTFVNLALRLVIQLIIDCTMKTPSGMERVVDLPAQIVASSTTLHGSASN